MPTFSNQAQLSYNGITANSNIAYGQILEVLAVSKTALSDTYTSGDRITYIFSIVNSGTTAFSDLTVTDNLGAYSFTTDTPETITLYPLTYIPNSMQLLINGTLQPAPTVTAADGITITGVSIPSGGNAAFIYQADINDYAPLAAAGNVINTVRVTGAQLAAPLTATHTISTDTVPNLSIVKGIGPAQIAENGRITYTFSIQNYGNTATTDDDLVQIRDTFTPILSDISVTYNGTVLPTSNYSYDQVTGVFSTNAGVINIPAATYVQSQTTGAYTLTPGTATVTVTGNISG